MRNFILFLMCALALIMIEREVTARPEQEPIGDEPECSKLMRTPTSFTEDDLEFIGHLRVEKVHVPQASKNYYDAINEAFISKGSHEQPMTEMCLEKVYSHFFNKHILTAYGLEKNLIIKNKTYGPTKNPGVETESEDGKYKVKMAVLYTDGKRYMFEVGCSKNNEVIWMVAAPQSKLDEEHRNKALQKRKQLKLKDLDGIVLPDSPNCGFSAIQYDERTCNILKTKSEFSSKDRKFIRELMAGDIFLISAHRDLLEELSNLLTGVNQNDMSGACMMVKFNETTQEQIVKGYGEKKIVDYRSKIYGATKNPGWQTLGKIYGNFDTKMAVIITDGKTYAVVAGCAGGNTVWFIAAREGQGLDAKIREKLFQRIRSLGISLDLSEWRVISHDNCRDGRAVPEEDIGDLDNPDVCSRKTDISQEGLDYIEKLKGKVLLDYQGNTDYFDAIKDMLLGGKSPDDQTDACISKFYSKDNNQLILRGYEDKVLKFKCEYIPNDETHNPGAKCKSEDGKHEFRFNVLHTDGKSYALTAFCRKDNPKIGFVVNLLPTTTLTPDVENYIKELVEKHTGETIYELDTPDTDPCKSGKPPKN